MRSGGTRGGRMRSGGMRGGGMGGGEGMRGGGMGGGGMRGGGMYGMNSSDNYGEYGGNSYQRNTNMAGTTKTTIKLKLAYR